jgi:PAS domain S-box-containing protein
MNQSPNDKNIELRVLLLTPTAGDAKVAAEILKRADAEATPCKGLLDLCVKVNEGAGALLIAEEAIATDERIHLIETLAAQEAWSDLPVIVLTTGGDGGHSTKLITSLFESVGNMVLLERPFRATTLVATVHVALRARRKQYEVRNLLLSERKARDELQWAQAERERYLHELGESERRRRMAAEAADVGTFHIDPATATLETDNTFRRLFGGSNTPLTYEQAFALVHPDDRDMLRARVAAAIDPNDRRPYVAEYRVVHPDGKIRWVLSRGGTVFSGDAADRRAVSFDGTVTDVTDRVMARQALEESQTHLRQALAERQSLLDAERTARAEAEQAGRMKDEFLATLSHELRTPLNAIVGWTQILKSGATDADDLSEGLSVIDRNARAQTQIIEDILDMSRIISGKLRLDVQRLDLAQIVSAGAETVQPAASAKGIRLQVLVDSGVGTISGDPGRLHQVFWNLVSNAVKFTPRGGRVQVLLERVNSHVEVSVIDTGEGIDPQFLPHVFDRFRQADASTTRRHGGLGLGLAIVKQLVELHGGSVHVKSPGKGKGTTFVVALPLTPIHAEINEPVRPREHPAAGNGSPVSRLACDQLRGVTVVAVDDEPDGVAVVRRLLIECGAIVRTANSAAEALALIKAEAPAVLISDIGMPGEDGYALIRQVRALPPDSGGRVYALALTAYARAADRVRALEAGFQMHLAKPVEPAELIVSVAALAASPGAKSLTMG